MELDELRQAIDDQGANWLAGETSLSPYEVSEDMEMLGYVPGPEELSLDEQELLAQEGLLAFGIAPEPSYPPAQDWRSTDAGDFITVIKDQNPCGSCVAFGTSAVVEGTLRVERNDPTLELDLSEAYLFFCVARAQGRLCKGLEKGGWWPAAALDALQADGAPDEACYPYVGHDQECTGLCQDWRSRATKITSWHEITSQDEMKEWLSSRGPLVGTMKVYEDFARFYTGGVYQYVSGKYGGGHCICIVGYNDEGKFWIGKNSWGPDWGEDGFFRIAYGECAIDSSMYAVEGVQLPGE
jgi:C1A family cysteine protease